MKLTVEVHGEFLPRRHSPVLEVADGTTVAALLEVLGVPREMPSIVLVNGRARGPDHTLSPDDEVNIFPPIAGGAPRAASPPPAAPHPRPAPGRLT